MKLFFIALFTFGIFSPLFSQQEVRWACKITGTNELHNGTWFSPKRVLGVPDVYPGFGAVENGYAWIAGYNNQGYLEQDTYVKVAFCDPIMAQQVVIVETFHPGSITSVTIIEASGKSSIVYKAKAEDLTVTSRVLSIPFKQTKTPVVEAIITTSGSKVKGWSYIDAIGIVSTIDPVNLNINVSKDAHLMGKSMPLSDEINTIYEETYPIISSDGNILYFARSGDPSNMGDASKTDIWYSTKNASGNWVRAKNMGKPLNNAGHNFVSSLTSDVNTLLVANTYNADGSSYSDGVSISHHTSTGWELPKTIVIDDYENLNPFISYFLASDGKTMLLGIEMPDSYGDLDLYVSFLKSDQTWTKPMNLGKQLNTFQPDATPFLAADGKTLYYGSCGQMGYGGYDIFMTKRLDDTWKNWSKPVNLGPDINTSAGELGFSVPASGDVAYTYSWRNDRYHSDIYTITLAPSVKPEPVTIIAGRVLDAKTNKPIGAKIEYNMLPSGSNVGYATSDPSTGSYKIVLNNNGTMYGYSAEVPGYFSVHEHITIDSKELYKEIQVDLLLIPIEKGQQMVLQNVFFYQSTPTLISSSYPELEQLIKVLEANPTLKIELDGHTDNQGNPELNVSLSEKRVLTVKEYLVTNGINAKRITTKAFGGSHPIAPNDSEENRKKNRRVGVTIIDF